MKKALEPGNIPNSGKLPEKFPSLGSGQIYYSGWWRERSQGDFTNPTTPVLPAKKIQQSSQVENRDLVLAKVVNTFYETSRKYSCFVVRHLAIILIQSNILVVSYIAVLSSAVICVYSYIWLLSLSKYLTNICFL